MESDRYRKELMLMPNGIGLTPNGIGLMLMPNGIGLMPIKSMPKRINTN